MTCVFLFLYFFFHSPEPKINTASKQCYASILYGKYSALSSFYCNIIIYLNEIVLFYDKNILTLLQKEQQYLKENKDEKKYLIYIIRYSLRLKNGMEEKLCYVF